MKSFAPYAHQSVPRFAPIQLQSIIQTIGSAQYASCFCSFCSFLNQGLCYLKIELKVLMHTYKFRNNCFHTIKAVN